MTHARRKYFEAQSSDIMRSMVMLAYIHLLYEVEREAREGELGAKQRLALRQARSLPILAEMKAYLERERSQVLPKSPISQAVGYTLSNWDALVRYCQGGDLEIDHNGAERSLRGVAVGRRNWTFLGSDNGGHTAAVLSSLIATCKRHHIDPFAYLRDVFQRIGAHPVAQLADLLPDKWLADRTAAASRPGSSRLAARLRKCDMGSPDGYRFSHRDFGSVVQLRPGESVGEGVRESFLTTLGMPCKLHCFSGFHGALNG